MSDEFDHPPENDDGAGAPAEERQATTAELYGRHGNACRTLARKLVGDEQLAEDVVQEVFISVWRGTSCYDGSRGTMQSWLLRITQHKAVDLVRREERHNRRAHRLADRASVHDATEEMAESVLRRQVVSAALRQLPVPQRQVLVLAYFVGLTQSEIAEWTTIPLGTVKTRTGAALHRLADALRADWSSSLEGAPRE